MLTKRRPETIGWGATGRTAIAVTDVDCLPVEARGDYTGRLYVFRSTVVPLWIDVRDVPTVLANLKAKGLKLEQLAGEMIEKRQEQLAKKAEKKAESKAERAENTGGD